MPVRTLVVIPQSFGYALCHDCCLQDVSRLRLEVPGLHGRSLSKSLTPVVRHQIIAFTPLSPAPRRWQNCAAGWGLPPVALQRSEEVRSGRATRR